MRYLTPLLLALASCGGGAADPITLEEPTGEERSQAICSFADEAEAALWLAEHEGGCRFILFGNECDGAPCEIP